MNDREQYDKITSQIAAAKKALADIPSMDDLELRQALKDAKQRANHHKKLIDDVDELRIEAVSSELVDFRRNYLADLEIKLAQTISRLGGRAPEPEAPKEPAA